MPKPTQSIPGRFYISRITRHAPTWWVTYFNVRATTGKPWQGVKSKAFDTEAAARAWAADHQHNPEG